MIRNLLAFLILLTLGLAAAQHPRERAMGGVTLPGPFAADRNPAYAAIRDRFFEPTWTLPLGTLGLLLPDRSPLYLLLDPKTFDHQFDLLSFYQQFKNLDVLLLNPSRSPEELVIKIRADGVKITDSKGNPLRLSGRSIPSAAPNTLTPPPFFKVPLWVGPHFQSTLGVFAGVDRLRVYPNLALAALLAGNRLKPNQGYEIHIAGGAQLGLGLDFSLAVLLPSPAATKVYFGARGEAFLGLGRVKGETTYRLRTDDQGKPAGGEHESRFFYSRIGDGLGYGLRLDLGVAFENHDGVFGIGIQNAIGFSRWHGYEVFHKGKERTRVPKTLTQAGFKPAFYLSGATYTPLEGLGRLLVAADLGYDGSLYGHLGAEFPTGPWRLRGGIGYREGLLFGTGFGIQARDHRVDLAFFGETTPWDGHLLLGISAGVGF